MLFFYNYCPASAAYMPKYSSNFTDLLKTASDLHAASIICIKVISLPY